MLSLTSKTGWFVARLTDTSDGVQVDIFRHLGGPLSKRISRDVLDCPFHVAITRVQELIDQLQRPLAPNAAAERYRVRSIIR